VSRRGIEGPPALVVDVLSPTTAARDRALKASRDAALGIAHDWLVDPRRAPPGMLPARRPR
jgi:Uma2 family endonuclease